MMAQNGPIDPLPRSRRIAPAPRRRNLLLALILVGLTGCLLSLAGCARRRPPAPATPTPEAGYAPSLPTLPTRKWDGPEWADQAQALIPARREDLERLGALTLYDIEIEVFPQSRSLTGRMQARFVNQETAPLDELVFRLYPNDADRGGSLKVENVTLGGRSVQPTYLAQDTAMRLPFATPLPVQAGVDVALDFHLDVPADPPAGYREFVYRDGIMTLPGYYPLIPAFDQRGWSVDVAPSYGDMVYADSALYRVRVTLPRPFVVVATGNLIQEAVDDGRQTKTLLFVSGPVREFNMVMSSDYQSLSEQVGATTVRTYFRPAGRTAGQRVLRIAAESLDVFDELFGTYPYEELDLAETPTVAGGIEYPGLIVLNQSYFQGAPNERMDWVVVHEVAHQWWYGVVGNDQLNEPWLDEALANYSTWLYFERTEGEDVASRLLEIVFREPVAQAQARGQDAPIGLPVEQYTADNYSPMVYDKGALFFHALREQVGSDTFLAILRTYFERYAYRSAAGTDFLALAEEVAGQELDALYASWSLPTPQ